MKIIGGWVLGYFVRAAITKYHRLGGLQHKFVFSSPGSYQSKIRVLAGSFSSAASLLAL